MRSIKFDQLGRKAPVAPAVLAPAATTTLAAGPRAETDPAFRVQQGREAQKSKLPADSDAAVSAGSQKT